jgi:plastocyanin
MFPHSLDLVPRLAVAALITVGAMAFPDADLRAETIEVKIRNNAFSPATVRIKVGDSVRWVWEGSSHSTTSGSGCQPDGLWDSGVQNTGFTKTVAFPKAGTFPYFCGPHCSLGMTGNVIVEQAANPTPSPPSPQSCSDSDPLNQNPIPAPIAKDASVRVALRDLVASGQGLVAPNWGTAAPGDRRHLFVTDTVGKLWAIQTKTGSKALVLDVSGLLVQDLGQEIPALPGYDERGLLGVAFHPQYKRNGLLYTFTSEPFDPAIPADFPLQGLSPGQRPNHRNVISEWRVADPRAAQPQVSGTRRVLLRIDHPQLNHNGGALNFGRDGYLYISLGDGGNANDQDKIGGHNPITGNGQDRSTVLGKILRIDPGRSGAPNGQYGIPRSNPFVAQASQGGAAGCADGVCDEIWAYGFRNPYRFSFDTGTHVLLVGDVGQNKIEEVDVVKKGANYGWRYKEGRLFFQPNGTDGSGTGFVSDRNCLNVPTAGLIDPIAQYDHDEGLAIVGGFIYRGQGIRALRGHYVFGDYAKTFAAPDGRLFHFKGTNQGRPRSALRAITELRLKGDAPVGLSIFGLAQDAQGELYVLGNTSGVPAPRDDRGRYLDTGVIRKLVPLAGRASAPIPGPQPAPTPAYGRY